MAVGIKDRFQPCGIVLNPIAVAAETVRPAAQDKAAQTMQRAEAQVALEKKRAMNEIKDDVSDMAVDIASAVLQRDIRSEEHTELIDSFIEKLGDSHD